MKAIKHTHGLRTTAGKVHAVEFAEKAPVATPSAATHRGNRHPRSSSRTKITAPPPEPSNPYTRQSFPLWNKPPTVATSIPWPDFVEEPGDGSRWTVCLVVEDWTSFVQGIIDELGFIPWPHFTEPGGNGSMWSAVSADVNWAEWVEELVEGIDVGTVFGRSIRKGWSARSASQQQRQQRKQR
ncbi:hypothetical protein HK102_002823 [Quaeritorhiza haematococci]|nr:hypothetical protein HK102_002823 [Quaeritorhiza haematococci]